MTSPAQQNHGKTAAFLLAAFFICLLALPALADVFPRPAVPAAVAPNAQRTFLMPEEAFHVAVERTAAQTIVVRFTPADGYYLYRDRIKITTGSTNAGAQLVFPTAESKEDPSFGHVWVYHHPFEVVATWPQNVPEQLAIGYQGCAERGICYPPTTVNFQSGPAGFKPVVLGGEPLVATLHADSTNPNDLNNRILISLLGYSVAGVPCSSANQGGAVDVSTVVGNDSGRIVCRGNNTITLESFVRGGGAGSSYPNTPLVLWYCMNPLGDSSGGAIDAQICTSMQKQNFNYSGVRGWVNSVLFGSADALSITPESILGKLNNNKGKNLILSDAQRSFVSSAGQPVLNLLMKARRNDDRISIALKLRTPIENCVVAELGRALVRSSSALTDANSFEMSSDIVANRDHLREDTLGYIKACAEDRAKENIVQYMNDATTLMSHTNK